MLPLNTITGSFGRMVRDLAQEAGKQAVLQIHGNETEIDIRVLEQIKDPLIHLLRNAIDHGIELPDERQAQDKSRVGTITLAAEQLGKDVIISVSDDGAGLNLGIHQALQRQDRASVEGLAMLNLGITFRIGISTSHHHGYFGGVGLNVK
jgi:two-component system chemotaxis sensor kinase CheA